MNFPQRDNQIKLGSQSGQAIIEYILVLVVTVALILGGLYQLNTAFKVWAKGYFGDYVSCLLESGELPDIGGSPGDSSICKSAFKEFSQADGGKGIAGKGGKGGGGGGPATAGNREGSRGGNASSGGGGGNSGGRFTAGSGFGRNNNGGKRVGSDTNVGGNTGNTGTNGGYGGGYRPKPDQQTQKLDNQFAFDNESNDKQKKKRDLASSAKTSAPDTGGGKTVGKILNKDLKDKNKDLASDGGMSFGSFLRYIIIAAIIIALVVLIGGQMLQVGKSME